MSIDDELYRHCLMCKTIEVQGIRMGIDAYYKIGGSKDKVTSGVCSHIDCRAAYIEYVSGGDERVKRSLEKLLL